MPGALGTLMVLLGIFALDLLPIRFTAVCLLIAAFALMLLEAKFGGHGALAIGRNCLPDLWDADPGGAPDSGASRESLGCHRGEPGIRRHHRLPGAAGRARAAHESHGSGPTRWWAARPLPWSRWLPKATCWWKARSGTPWPANRCQRAPRLRVVGHEQYLLRVAPVEPALHRRTAAA